MRFPFKFPHWALVIGYWSFAFVASAQTAPEEPKPAKLHFLFLDETPGAYVLKTGHGYRQISSTPYAISPEFTPANFDRLEIYKTNPIPDPVTGEIGRIKIANITPPAGTPSVLLIVTPRTAPAGTTPPALYDVEQVDGDIRTAPAGSLRLLNRGRVTLGAQIGSDQIVVKPGETRIIKPITDQRLRVRIKIAVDDHDGWKLIDDRIVKVRNGSRITGILVFSPSGLRYTYPPDEVFERGPPPPGHFWLTYTDTP